MIILDNSVLSAFKRLDELRLIKELFRDVAIPAGVYDEFIKRWMPDDLPGWIKIEETGDGLPEAEQPGLGRGEVQAIFLARHKDCILALDDEQAREYAEKTGVTLIGSVGILRMAYTLCPIKTKSRLKELLNKLAEDVYLEKWLIDWVLKAEK